MIESINKFGEQILPSFMITDFTHAKEIFEFSLKILIQKSKTEKKLHFLSTFITISLTVDDYVELLKGKRQAWGVGNNKFVIENKTKYDPIV